MKEKFPQNPEESQEDRFDRLQKEYKQALSAAGDSPTEEQLERLYAQAAECKSLSDIVLGSMVLPMKAAESKEALDKFYMEQAKQKVDIYFRLLREDKQSEKKVAREKTHIELEGLTEEEKDFIARRRSERKGL